MVVWNRKHIQYWSEFIPADKIRFVRGGIDLNLWRPDGPETKFGKHPTILYCDSVRTGSIPLKNPFNTLLAVKKVAREIPSTRLQLLNVPPEKQVFWSWLVGRLHIESTVENFLVGVATDMDKIYRGADLLLHLIQGGSISSVGCEGMSCGLPTIVLEGEEDTYASLKCLNDPESIAEAIMTLWEHIREDSTVERLEARKIAETHYDLSRTVKELLSLYQEYFGLPNSKRVAAVAPRTMLEEKVRMDRYWSKTPRDFGFDEDRFKVMADVCEGKTLDLGCGKGPYTHLLPEGPGLDISREALKEYRRGWKIQGDAESLPVRDEAFDTVFCSELLEHVEDDVKVVSEVFRVLRPGGVFVLSVPNGLREEWHSPDWKSPTDKRIYTPETLTQLLGENLKFHSVRYGDPQRELRLVASIKKEGG